MWMALNEKRFPNYRRWKISHKKEFIDLWLAIFYEVPSVQEKSMLIKSFSFIGVGSSMQTNKILVGIFP